MLSSSPGLRAAVREAASKPKGQRVDARVFRRWMSMPAVSDPLLQDLGKRYAHEIKRRELDGEIVPRTVGVQALLALGHDAMTVERFTTLLAELRADPPDFDEEPGHSVTGTHTDDDQPALPRTVRSQVVEDLTVRLQNRATQVVEQLTLCIEDVRSGKPVLESTDLLDSWNTEIASAWAELGEAEVPAHASFSSMEQVRERLAADEELEADRARAREHEAAERDKRLEQLRATATALEPLIGDARFRSAYEQANQQIAELESEYETSRITTDAPEVGRTGDTDSASPDLTGGFGAPSSTTRSGVPGRPTDVPGQDDEPVGSRTAVGVAVETSGEEDSTDRLIPVATNDASPEMQSHPRIAASTAVATEANAEAHETAGPLDTDAHAEAAKSSYNCADDLVRHLFDRNFGAAWLVAQAAGLPDADIQAYRFAAAAFHCATGSIDPAEVLIGLTTLLGGRDFATSHAARTALAATLRAGLAAGWIPRSELESIARQANLDTAWRTLVDAAIAASDRNYQHLQDSGDRRELSTDDVTERARGLRAEIEGQRIKFARADKVRKYLLSPQQPLGAAFAAILGTGPADERRLALTEALARLEQPDDVIKAADQAVSSPQQLRRHIESHARNRLRKMIESVAECATEALNAAVVVAADSPAAVTQQVRHELVAAAQAARASVDDTGPGEVALARLADWIVSPESPARVASELAVLIEASLPVVCADRDASGLPIITPDNRNQIITELRTPLTYQELFETYFSWRSPRSRAGGRTPAQPARSPRNGAICVDEAAAPGRRRGACRPRPHLRRRFQPGCACGSRSEAGCARPVHRRPVRSPDARAA